MQYVDVSEKHLESLEESVGLGLVINKKMPKIQDFKRARLVKSNHNKGWYVQFYVWDVQKNKLVRRKRYIPSSYTSKESKLTYGRDFVKRVNSLLRKGYHIDRTLSPEKILQEEVECVELTFNEAIPRYINYCDKIAKNSSKEVSSKYSALTRFLNWCKKHNYQYDFLNEVSERAAIRFFDDLIEVDGLGGKTFNNILTRLRNFYNVAAKRKWFKGDNPFKAVDKQKVGYGEKNRAYTDSQLKVIIPYIKENDLYLYQFIGFIYYALMRPAEIKRLRVKNIDMISRTIRIEASQSKVKRLDILPIADGLYDILKSMNLENENPDHYLFSTLRTPSETPMGREWTSAHFKKIKNKFNLDSNYSIYGFKHTAVCKWYEQTKDIVRVQRMCRHSSIDMTARYLKSLGVMGDQYKIESLPNLL